MPEEAARTFLAEYRAGRATADDLVFYVHDWHVAEMGTFAARVELHEYLGLTWEQYQRWTSTGELPIA